jgi:S-DNA-T family DNA segregation ATPase FtsK/SpoIIIE
MSEKPESAHFDGARQKASDAGPRRDSLDAEAQLKFRAIAIGAAAFLGLCALLMGLSLLNALFGLRVFPAMPGIFFSRSYGILAFFIPANLGYAAFILADPRWRPGRIFILSAGIFPFLTLAAGFAFIRDFEVRSKEFAFLDFAGKTGFGFFIVLFTMLEVLALRMLKNALFPPESVSEDHQDEFRRLRRKGPVLFPPPGLEKADVETAAPAGDTGRIFRHVALIGEKTEFKSEVPARTADLVKWGTFLLPELKPLGSAAVFRKLDEAADLEGEYRQDMPGGKNETEREDDNFTVTRDADGAAANSVERAIEEAEAAAEVHSEQERKKAANIRSAASSFVSKKNYMVPVEILNKYPDGEYWIVDQATRDAAMILKETLEEFKIQAEVTGIRKGPVITMFEILPAPGVKLSRIVNLQDNIALRLAASSVRIVAPIPGKHAVGIEVPNVKRNIVSFREIIEGELRRPGTAGGKRPEIPVVMGKDITGEAQTIDLIQMPHLLIAGATGAGKSVCVNSMILSILYQLHPSECRLILIDPKIVELKLYNDIPHLLTPVITEPKRAFQALQYCIYEMERRYACLDSMGVRDIRNYNKRIKEKNIAQEHMPYIVVVIDEFADLMATTGKELESTVARLAAMSRAVGIHLVLATQRPSIDVITGLIKANIPSRIAFMVASKMDSRIIIDMVGAEKLLGKGDMLYAGAVDPFPIRMQGAFVSEEEVEAVVSHVKTLGEPEYIDDEIFYDDEEDDAAPSLFGEGDDPLYDKALEIVIQQGKASASFIQRRLKIGYNRAARLVEEMEHRGVVGPAQGSKPRELLRGV